MERSTSELRLRVSKDAAHKKTPTTQDLCYLVCWRMQSRYERLVGMNDLCKRAPHTRMFPPHVQRWNCSSLLPKLHRYPRWMALRQSCCHPSRSPPRLPRLHLPHRFRRQSPSELRAALRESRATSTLQLDPIL